MGHNPTKNFIRRYGARLDELARIRALPSNDDEQHFLTVCMGHAEPRSDRERLWLYAQMVCRYEKSLQRAARTDLVEHENDALRIENRRLRGDLAASERVQGDSRRAEDVSRRRGAHASRMQRCVGDARFSMRERSPEWTMFECRKCH